jgi:hypothetical protein
MTPPPEKTRTGKLVLFAVGFVLAIGVVMVPSLPSLSSLLPFTGATSGELRKPSAFGGAPGNLAGPAVPQAFQGVWQGQSVIARGLCTLELEIRGQREDGRVAGFSSLTCLPLTRAQAQQMGNAAALFSRLTPTSAILSGAWEKGALRFSVEKNIGGGAKGTGCAMHSFTATPFGTSALSTEWIDAACGNGQLMVKKIRP